MTSGKNMRPLWYAYLAVTGAWTFGGIVFMMLHLVAPKNEEMQRIAAVALISTVFLFVLVERASNLIEFQREERKERRLRVERERRMDEILAELQEQDPRWGEREEDS